MKSFILASTIKVLLDGECVTDDHCDDGNACNGEETCVDNACQSGTQPVGARMLLFGPALTQQEIDLIKNWIDQGAMNN